MTICFTIWPFGGRSQLHNRIFIRFIGNVHSWIHISFIHYAKGPVLSLLFEQTSLFNVPLEQQCSKIAKKMDQKDSLQNIFFECLTNIFRISFEFEVLEFYSDEQISFDDISLRDSKWRTNHFWRHFVAGFKMANSMDRHLEPHFLSS